MGALGSIFKKKDPRTPIKGPLPRIKNIFTVHFRGLIGVIVPIALLSWQPSKGQNDITVMCLWFWMAWFFLLQPVNVPVVGLIPLFLLPMAGVMSTVDTCTSYFDDNVALFILAGMIHLLLNSCGADRRIILWLLCSGDSCQFSGKRMVLKASAAAFFMSIISNRLIVTSTIIQYLTPAYMNLQSSTAKYRSTEPDYDVMRHIVLCAVQTASSIGSVAVLHASFATLAMRAIWSRHPPKGEEFPDIFNYLQYTCFAFPLAFLMFIFNFIYHMLLINYVLGKPMSGNSMAQMRNMLLEQEKTAKPSLSTYQKWCIFFYFGYLAMCMFRWSDWLNMGWSGFKKVVPEVPLIKDATVAAIFVVGLHVLPKSFLFMNYLTARTKSDIGEVLKPDSPVMWWRYVDKNTNYGYIFLIGGGIALNTAFRVSKANEIITKHAKSLTGMDWNAAVFVISVIATLLPNVMTGVAAVCTFLPFVLHMATPTTTLRDDTEVNPWTNNNYLAALAVGIGSSLGFAAPFLYTPAYFCHYTGKVPKKQMIKYAIGSAIICFIILGAGICIMGPIVWVSKSVGVKSYAVITAAETTAATESTPEA
ncbi:protein I'm not dead yet-like [Maniola jurtina]|uniref:protein I'm not dead yet-like n=1 Tax=Maniola jurtina TaxID=191418 RepID=UPI001E68819C|nr:protein I'm not dead yet-like [Maniola jurtina]